MGTFRLVPVDPKVRPPYRRKDGAIVRPMTWVEFHNKYHPKRLKKTKKPFFGFKVKSKENT